MLPNSLTLCENLVPALKKVSRKTSPLGYFERRNPVGRAFAGVPSRKRSHQNRLQPREISPMPPICLKEGQNPRSTALLKSLTYTCVAVDGSTQAAHGFTFDAPPKNLTFGNFICGKAS